MRVCLFELLLAHELPEDVRVLDVERHGVGHGIMFFLLVNIEVIVSGGVFAIIDDGWSCHLPVFVTT